MPLPALRADGTLPPGVHSASLEEVFAHFPATTAQRQALDAALSSCVVVAKRLRLADKMALDGSYITDKQQPSDVDVIVFDARCVSTHWRAAICC